jgi:hypothetical protein
MEESATGNCRFPTVPLRGAAAGGPRGPRREGEEPIMPPADSPADAAATAAPDPPGAPCAAETGGDPSAARERHRPRRPRL